ncbi:MAG TPA: type II and III secretion system protein family protein [Caulobacteraceae bacterium]|jgi:pilus assembly protein CpaC
MHPLPISPSSRQRLAVAALAILGAAALCPAAASAEPDDSSSRTIVVAKDKSAAFRLDYPVGEIVVAQPDMVQLVATTDHSFYIRGKTLGVTNLLIYDQRHHLAQVIDVRVGQDVESLQQDIDVALPGEHITASNFAGGVLLSGNATTTAVAARAAEIAERYAPKGVSSTIKVANNQQVEVEVRFIEASRSSLKDVGFNFDVSTPGGGFGINSGSGLAGAQPAQATVSGSWKVGTVSFDARLEALEQKGVIRTLAKPNLMAMSGEEASFLAGGEIPYPVPNGLTGVTLDFRQYGVKLKVTPTVEDNGQIRLKVSPEVSQLDQSTAVSIGGITVPGILETNASTTVDLHDGQSFAIAGLFQQDYNDTVHQVPGLGDVPVLGSLFRSANWQHKQTELIIIVTPKLTSPVDHIESLPNPLVATQEPSGIDLILDGLTYKPGTNPPVATR